MKAPPAPPLHTRESTKNPTAKDTDTTHSRIPNHTQANTQTHPRQTNWKPLVAPGTRHERRAAKRGPDENPGLAGQDPTERGAQQSLHRTTPTPSMWNWPLPGITSRRKYLNDLVTGRSLQSDHKLLKIILFINNLFIWSWWKQNNSMCNNKLHVAWTTYGIWIIQYGSETVTGANANEGLVGESGWLKTMKKNFIFPLGNAQFILMKFNCSSFKRKIKVPSLTVSITVVQTLVFWKSAITSQFSSLSFKSYKQ